MTTTGHVAPARQVFAVAHLPDPQRPPTPTDDATTGHTICGLPMLASDVWIDYQPTPGDRICGGCLGAPVAVEDDLFSEAGA